MTANITLPRRLVMVGGGYISVEFAHVAARTGAHVTIVSKGVRPLEISMRTSSIKSYQQRANSISPSCSRLRYGASRNAAVNLSSPWRRRTGRPTISRPMLRYMGPAACQISMRSICRPVVSRVMRKASSSTSTSKVYRTRSSTPQVMPPTLAASRSRLLLRSRARSLWQTFCNQRIEGSRTAAPRASLSRHPPLAPSSFSNRRHASAVSHFERCRAIHRAGAPHVGSQRRHPVINSHRRKNGSGVGRPHPGSRRGRAHQHHRARHPTRSSGIETSRGCLRVSNRSVRFKLNLIRRLLTLTLGHRRGDWYATRL